LLNVLSPGTNYSNAFGNSVGVVYSELNCRLFGFGKNLKKWSPEPIHLADEKNWIPWWLNNPLVLL
jgi:hypothetical protein